MAEWPQPPPEITFRPLAPGDLPTLHRWLSNPRVYRWYGGTPPTLGEVQAKYAPRILAAAAIRPYVILHDTVPIGYIQSYMVADDPEYAALVGDTRGAAALDILIGEDDSALRGLGTASVRAFLNTVIFAEPGTTRCFIDPHPDNLIAIRAYTRAGFRPLRRIDPTGAAEPCLLMRIERAEMDKGVRGTIARWSPEEIGANEEAIRLVFAAAFAMSATEAARFTAALGRHATRRDFRFFAATAPDSGPLLGFIYGYSGEPGQWFHDLLRATLPPEHVARWLADSFELVEFGVLPEAQGQGFGGRLHDALLASVTNRTAILTTRRGNTAARQFYLRRGWQEVCAEYHFPNNVHPYAILGRDRTPGR